MQNTPNLNLSKPDGNNLVDISVINGNMDIIDQEVNNKVAKEAGKGLSTNDYTTAEKDKLASLSNYDSTAVDQHMADNTNPHGVTVGQIGAETPAGAQAKANAAASAANTYTDGHINNTNNPHGATSEATANKIVLRDASGKTKLAGLFLSDGSGGLVELKLIDGYLKYEVIS